MAHVGSFGAARKVAVNPDELDTFEVFGVTFRVAPDAGGAGPLCDYAEAVGSGEDSSSIAALAAMKAMVYDCVYAEDQKAFWETFSANKGTPDELGELCAALWGHVAGRPTDRPADSSDGPSATAGTASNGPSSATPPQFAPATFAQVPSTTPMVAQPNGNGGYVASPGPSPVSSPTPS
jgi:hypothetical protein